MEKGKLIKKIQISGIIKSLTGLHIGGSNLGVSIGGADAVVIRNPFNNQPYIPGSTLKGKMRTLTERIMGKFSGGITPYGPYIDDPESLICQIYGITPDDAKKAIERKNGKGSYKEEIHAKPTSRLIVRDSNFTESTVKKLENSKNTDMPFTEIKTEVVIDRITSAATPRQLERVPAGAEFEMSLILNIYDGDNEEDYLNKIFMALALVQDDYIGGKGTRGSGEVNIVIEKLQQKAFKDYEENNDWQNYTGIAIPPQLQK